MGTVVERLQLLITASAKGVASEIREVENASGGAAQKTSLLQSAQKKLGVEGISTGAIMSGALAGGIAVGGAAIAKFAADGIEQFASLTGEVRGFQRVAGTTAEDSSKLVFAVKELGIAPEVASKAFGRLATNIGTGKADLSQYGVEVAKNKDGTVDLAGTVANLSEAYQNTEDPTKRAALANDAFGKSWQTLAPLLGKGKDDLKAIYEEAGKDHQIFSQQDLENGRKFTVATRELSSALQGLEVEVGSKVIPYITDFTSGVKNAIQFGDRFGNTLDQQSVSFGGLTASAKDAAGAYAEAGVKSVPVVGQLYQFGKILGSVGGLFDSGGESAKSFSDKQKDVQDATVKVADAVAEHGKNSKEARDAEAALSTASKALKGDQDAVGESLQKVNDNLTTHTQKLYEDQQATLLAGADTLNYDNAIANVTQGLYDLSAAQGSGTASSFELEQKQRDLAGAVFAVVGAAQKRATDALGPGASAEDVAKAKTDATRDALQGLYEKFPGLRGQVQGYVGDLGTVPPAKNTSVNLDIWEAQANLYALESTLNRITSGVHTVTISVVGGARELAGG